MTSTIYDGLEPAEVWRHFASLNSIPRASGEEAAAGEYVKALARAAGAEHEEDARGNVLVRVKSNAKSTPENRVPHGVRADTFATTMIQSHLDMVCQKLPNIEHDFSRDPIRPQRETTNDGDIIRASGTTLGADNGIGAAMALALLTSPDLQHGDLELLFTVEEETGLFGAAALDASLVNADYLINLDSEDPDELTVGCAGGAGTDLHLPIERENFDGWLTLEVKVSGLKGGHSGVQIHEPLANAMKLLIDVLRSALGKFHLVSIEGGNAHNVIPRDATARILVAPESLQDFKSAVETAAAALREQWQADESNLKIEVQEIKYSGATLTSAATRTVLDLLQELPHGVIQMSKVFEGKVETSSNLAIVETRADELKIHVSNRSFVADALELQQQSVKKIGEKYGATHQEREGYPGWEPNANSQLLQVAKIAYEETYGKAPDVQVIHAGLECGIIVAKKPNIDAISFGPLIRFAHSPDECVYASTVASSWKLLLALLAKIAV